MPSPRPHLRTPAGRSPAGRPVLAIALVLAAALALGACGGSSASTEEVDRPVAVDGPASGTSSGEAAEGPAGAGSYVDLADYEADPATYAGNDVVLFFHADWCPTCRAADEALAGSSVPDGLTVVKVDFDGEQDLRSRYGVTLQHTFVQVDPDGEELARWSGSTTAEEIVEQTV